MKFKVGDKVRIKNLAWYNENKDKNGYVYGNYPLNPFDPERAKYCGQEYEVVYADKIDNTYQLDCGEEDIRTYWWTEEMIEKIEVKPLFTLTAKEVETTRFALEVAIKKHKAFYDKGYYKMTSEEKGAFERVIYSERNLLTRIKQWQDVCVD